MLTQATSDEWEFLKVVFERHGKQNLIQINDMLRILNIPLPEVSPQRHYFKHTSPLRFRISRCKAAYTTISTLAAISMATANGISTVNIAQM